MRNKGLNMREISLDTETTGLDPASGHRIVEIGCVEMIDHISTKNNFHVYLNPERDMPKEAEAVHGISAEFLKDKPLFKEVAKEMVEFFGDSPLVIHNAAFDMKFINHELKNIGMAEIPMSQTIDTVKIARNKFPGQPANLDALCRRFNIDLSARTKHGALLDAELLADVYLELMGGRQVRMSLDMDEEKKSEKQTKSETTKTTPKIIKNLKPRDFPLTQEEIELHDQMLKEIKEPLWGSI